MDGQRQRDWHWTYQSTRGMKFSDQIKGRMKKYAPDDEFDKFRLLIGSDFRSRVPPIRSTSVGQLAMCPRFFLWRVRYGLQRKGAYQGALSIGTYFHMLCELAAVTPDAEQAAQQASIQIEATRQQLIDAADAQGILPDGKTIENVIADDERNYALAQVMFQIAYRRFFQAPFLTKDDWKVVAVEQVLEARYREIGTRLRCKPDVILARESDKSLMIVNYKTTSFSPKMTMASSPYRFQVWMEHLLTHLTAPEGWTVRFYLHNVILKTGLRYPAKKYPTWDDYLTAVQTWYEDKHEQNPNDPPLLQDLCALPAEPMTAEFFTRLQEASRAHHCHPNSARFYRDASACMGKFTSSPCPFLGLCTSSPLAWADIIPLQFEQSWREAAEDQQARDARKQARKDALNV